MTFFRGGVKETIFLHHVRGGGIMQCKDFGTPLTLGLEGNMIYYARQFHRD